MFRVDFLDDDGWTHRYVGRYGVLLRRNPEHIQRVLRAIEQRHERDSDMRVEINMKELMS